LREFLEQQNENHQKKVLPLLYEISLDELKKHYPDLGDIQCINAQEHEIEEIVILLAKELIKRYR
jgi:CRISPR/Cas system-associated protein endoribonuclease Cas2